MNPQLVSGKLSPGNFPKSADNQKSLTLRVACLIAVVLWFSVSSYRCISYILSDDSGIIAYHTSDSACPQVDVLVPSQNYELWTTLGDNISTDKVKDRAIAWLSGAIQVKTECYDDMHPVGKDPRWEVFGPFHEYLARVFPAVHQTLSLKKINTYGLLYEWTSSDSSLKPILLAAHQDVVPVHPDTVSDWTHPPYSGEYDGTRIWGRGSSDDKSGLIGILSSLEVLIEAGFKPTRTIVVAFGFDEECSGLEGAGQLSDAMLDIYGKDAFAFVVDEGGGFEKIHGSIFATPAVAEKGYLDTRVSVASPGGHSSVPPSHTSIGMLSALLVHYENNPFDAHITRDTIPYETLQCYAIHGSTIPTKLKLTIKASAHSDLALIALENLMFKDIKVKSLFGTTQAIDLVGGGVKTNALPENAWAVVNHRISTTSTVAETMAIDRDRLTSLAKDLNLTFTAFGDPMIVDSPLVPSKGSLVLSDAFGNQLEPAPRTPIKGEEAGPYKFLSGTIKAAYNAHRALEGDNIAVSPGMSTGNTDTRFYWKLTRHIFRYNHKNSVYDASSPSKGIGNGVHTVNEYIEVDAFLEMIRFFETLILNADEATEF